MGATVTTNSNVSYFRSFQEIVGYLERQYDDILAEESRIKRNPRFRDNRVHALLYFIPPTGHAYVFQTCCVWNVLSDTLRRLREMDIELMRRLSPRVNVIPVIGKADSLTPSELRGFKKRVRIIRRDELRCLTIQSVSTSTMIDHGGHRVLRHPRVQFPL